MQVRKPIVAGQFYPDNSEECSKQIYQILDSIMPSPDLPDSITAGIVPHAGWTFSGRTAAMVFWAIKQLHETVHTFVIFGASHRYYGDKPAVYDMGFWETPLGNVAVNEELAQEILEESSSQSNPREHNTEHSIEVQVPFIQQLFPDAKILPILVPQSECAVKLGKIVGGLISQQQEKIICIGTTDLTHYGPRYGFTPMGSGEKGLKWANDVNDQRFIKLALRLESESILNEAHNYFACGPGAAAAVTSFAKTLEIGKGILLEHTNSNNIMLSEYGTTGDDSVGYAAIIF